MVQELSCPPGMMFDTMVQGCNWEDDMHGEECNNQDDMDCLCEYVETRCTRSLQQCTRSLQDLTAETISTWVSPTECTAADDVCSAGTSSVLQAGDLLFHQHKSEVCVSCFKECEEGTLDSQYCRDYVTYCQCDGIQAACKRGDAASCSRFADTCCNDNACKCEPTSKLCSLSLESASDQAPLSQYCLDAEEACNTECTPIQVHNQSIGSCQSSCNFWDELCTSSPGLVCLFFAGRCCGSPDDVTHNAQCYCDMGDYLSQNLNYELDDEVSCSAAEEAGLFSNSTKEKESLIGVFNELGGAEWLNENDTWLANGTEHCEWFGITCDVFQRYIVEIDLTGNNLVGAMDSSRFFAPLNKLEVLKLSDNKLKGIIDFNSFYQLKKLKHLDMSRNDLSGEVDVLLSPAIEHLDLSQNNLTSLINFKFRGSQNTLETLYLSQNNIRQNVSRILENIPRTLKELVLVENHVQGSLPNPLPVLAHLERFIMRSNDMEGQIPDMSQSFQQLQELDLSHQKQDNGGLSGSIPAGWTNLLDLALLDISANNLKGVIPLDLGNLPKLRKLIVSNNELSGDIPPELGKLSGTCDVLDMSNNNILTIPASFGEFRSFPDTWVNLTGNKIADPAPLGLCYVSGFDLQHDATVCPPDRNALSDFYHSAKGGEWTESDDWILPQNDHCLWFGVTCKNDSVTEVNLTNNGLSGKLNGRVSELHSLEVLDLSDNDVKGTIPLEIGELSSLTHLRLSFNSFISTVPTELGNLQNLKLVHFHGNRLQGTMPKVNTENMQDHSSFISDCGIPTDLDTSLSCENCTICCNSKGDCHITELGMLEQLVPGFSTLVHFIWVLVCLLLGYALVVVSAASLHDWRKPPTGVTSVDQDKKYALDSIGRDSVYSFILGKRTWCRVLALAVVVLQVVALYFFVHAAQKDFSNDSSAYAYKWKCPRDSLECEDDSDTTKVGWVIFTLLMAAHLLTDLINGMKLLIMSGQRRHGIHRRMSYFTGGLILTLVSAFAMYSSIVYNQAISTSDSALIANVVVIIFVVDVDEYVYMVMMAASAALEGHGGADDEEDEEAVVGGNGGADDARDEEAAVGGDGGVDDEVDEAAAIAGNGGADNEGDEDLTARVERMEGLLRAQVGEFERRFRNEEQRNVNLQHRVDELERQAQDIAAAGQNAQEAQEAQGGDARIAQAEEPLGLLVIEQAERVALLDGQPQQFATF